jgi:oxygen-independent coproporphyrinogen-3 oxidase
MSLPAKAIELNPRHISVYALTIEPRCRLTAPDEETQLRAIEDAESLLTAAGYIRYEISNYAKPGFEAKHNVSCWRGEDYLGFGPAASSRAGLKRWTNKPSVEQYVAALAAGRSPPRTEEIVSAETNVAERLAFAFRLLVEGVDLGGFAAMPGSRIESWNNTLARLAADGLTNQQGARWFLTRRGRNLADFVAGKLLE